MALTWATPSSSLSTTGTRIVSSMVYVSGSVRLAGKLILLHRRVVSSQGTTQELNPSGSPVNLRLPSSQIVLADSLLEDFSVGKVEDNSTLGSRGYRPDLFTQSHNPQGLLYTVTGRLRALRDVLLEGRMGRGKGEGKRGWRCPMKCVGPSRDESCYCRSIRGDKDG